MGQTLLQPSLHSHWAHLELACRPPIAPSFQDDLAHNPLGLGIQAFEGLHCVSGFFSLNPGASLARGGDVQSFQRQLVQGDWLTPCLELLKSPALAVGEFQSRSLPIPILFPLGLLLQLRNPPRQANQRSCVAQIVEDCTPHVRFGKRLEWGLVARAVELRRPHQPHQPHLLQIIEGLGSAGRIESGNGPHEHPKLLNAAIAAGNRFLG